MQQSIVHRTRLHPGKVLKRLALYLNIFLAQCIIVLYVLDGLYFESRDASSGNDIQSEEEDAKGIDMVIAKKPHLPSRVVPLDDGVYFSICSC